MSRPVAHGQDNDVCDSTRCCCPVQPDVGPRCWSLESRKSLREGRDGSSVSFNPGHGTPAPWGESESESHPLCHPTSCPRSRHTGKPPPGTAGCSPSLRGPSSLSARHLMAGVRPQLCALPRAGDERFPARGTAGDKPWQHAPRQLAVSGSQPGEGTACGKSCGGATLAQPVQSTPTDRTHWLNPSSSRLS